MFAESAGCVRSSLSKTVTHISRMATLRAKSFLEARQRGLIMTTAGAYAQCLRSLVPLVVSDELLDEGLDIFAEATEAAIKS